jgi:hypothetical protein
MILDDLRERLTKAFGDQIVSVILYGSAALGSPQGEFSDYNVLCVLRSISTRELAAAEPVVKWWRDKGYPAPVLMTEAEVRGSTDCFAMEFADMKLQHRILQGEDVLTQLEVDTCFYRARVEFELRAKLLRLRQRAAGILHDSDLLLRLIADSFSTFAVVMRHSLILAGDPPLFDKADLTQRAADRFGLNPEPFLTVLAFRQGKKKPREIVPVDLFDAYLKQLETLAEAVDRIEK